MSGTDRMNDITLRAVSGLKAAGKTVNRFSFFACTCAIVFCCVTITLEAGFVARKSSETKIFYSETDVEGWNALVRGRVESLGTRDIAPDELNQSASGRSKITMILDNADGLLQGDELYVINDKHLIVAKLSLVSILKSVSFGYIGVGYGNFRRVQKNYLVVQRVTESNSRYAYIYKSRGDFYRNTGDTAQAIIHYEKALSLNRNHPESHLALAQIYYTKNMIDYAEKEYRLAYDARGYLYDNEDRIQLYRGLLEIFRYKAFDDDRIAAAKRTYYLDEGLRVARQAEAEFRKDHSLLFYLGLFNFHKSNDVESKRALVALLQDDPENVDALLLLAQLYERHRNRERALEYVEAALTVEPDSPLAKDLYEKFTR